METKMFIVALYLQSSCSCVSRSSPLSEMQWRWVSFKSHVPEKLTHNWCEPFFFFLIHLVCLSSLACQTLAVSQLDSVIIAPPGPLEGDSQTLAHLQPAWEELEALVRSQRIAAIGTSDLDKDLLEQLYNWAQVSGNLVTGHNVSA